MNERIRELRRQATLVETYTSHNGSVHEGKSVDLEKFAELIVRECAEVITETRWHLPPTQQQIAVGIKEHFGVNE
jgi:predicted SnoaL-like aldol condensation-catalyzing enzyme